MKQGTSLLLGVAMIVALLLPVQAATGIPQPQTEEPRQVVANTAEIHQRIQNIRDTYHIPVVYAAEVKDQVSEYLDDLEEALSMVGATFAKKAVQHYNNANSKLRVRIVPFPDNYANQPWIDAVSVSRTARNSEQCIYLFVKEKKTLRTSTVLHELGHVLHDCIGYGQFVKINGVGKNYGYTRTKPVNSTQYVSVYATNNHFEDFAETFMYMVLVNEDAKENYRSLSPSSKLYKKYHYVYSKMDEFLGSGSRATKRAAIFLDL